MIYKRGQLPSILLQDKKNYRKFDDDMIRYLNEQDQNLFSIFSNGVSFADNFNGELITFTSDPSGGTEDAIPHTLKRIPTGYIVVRKNSNAHLYDGGTSFDIQKIYLKSDTGSTTFTILVF